MKKFELQTRLRPILATLLAFLVGGSEHWLGAAAAQNLAQTTVEEAFAPHVSFETIPRRQSIDLDSTCEEALSEATAFYAYEAVLVSLLAGTSPDEVPHVDCFVTERPPGATAQEVHDLILTTSFERNVLLGYLNFRFERSIERTIEQGYDRGGFVAWPGSYVGEAALLAFRRTGDVRFLILFKDYFDRLLLLSDPRLGIIDQYHGRIMNSWGYNMPAGVLGEADHREWVAHVTHFGRIMTPAMGFASEVLDDPALTEEYGSWAYDILRFFETGWHQFEADRRPFGDGTRSWYWRPIDDEFEPINHVTSLGRALVAAYEITGDPVYARRIEEIIWVFEDAMNVHPSGTVSWPYSPSFQTPSSMQSGIDTEYSEYTWKAAITLPFVEDARRAGFPMSQGVSDSIRNRLTGFVLANGIWKRNIHPYGARPISPGETSRLNPALGGFHMTFPDDSEIAELIKQMMVSNQDIYDRGWFTHPGTARSFALFIQ